VAWQKLKARQNIGLIAAKIKSNYGAGGKGEKYAQGKKVQF
jgi:hypothetical protein